MPAREPTKSTFTDVLVIHFEPDASIDLDAIRKTLDDTLSINGIDGKPLEVKTPVREGLDAVLDLTGTLKDGKLTTPSGQQFDAAGLKLDAGGRVAILRPALR